MTGRAALALAALAVTSCGEESRPAGVGDRSAETVTVRETEFRLSPAEAKVSSGAVALEAVNDGKLVHALAVDSPGGEVATAEIEPGKSARLEARLDPGTYRWYCPVGRHEQQGMKGTITVGSAAAPKGESTTEGGGGGGGGY